jgi:hypothetical protein
MRIVKNRTRTRRRVEPNGRAELRRAVGSVRRRPARKDLARALAVTFPFSPALGFG